MANGTPIYDEVLQSGEYILRSDAVDALAYFDENSPTGKTAKEIIAGFPAADAVPAVHGYWVWDENGMDWGLGAWRCSVCGCKPETWWEADRKYIPRRCSGSKFCGNCGAKMDEVV